MKRILIVEDSKMFATMISRKIRFELEFERDIAPTLKRAKELIRENKGHYFLAVVDLNLPDAPDGQSVDYVLSRDIPVIVFTSQFNDEIRERMLSKNVVDYILKEGGPQVVDYLINSIDRFYKNQFSKVMVVDDSRTSRTSMTLLLESQQFVVIEAPSGTKALALLEKHPDTKVIICDYNMPGMDGFELITRIRQNYPKNRLAVIGVSGYGTGLLSVRLLKAGASDFLTKPFLEEELYCRINQNIEMLEYIDTIEKTSNVDHLTGIFNRRYFFQLGHKLIENMKRNNIHLTVAMINIDRFKVINDNYGYEAGDAVLIEVSQLLTRSFRSADVIARFGGEQFCIAAPNMDRQSTSAVFERVRTQVAKKRIECGNTRVSVTVSIGVTTLGADSIDEMLKRAEELLRDAKKNGRNRIEVG
ncbi:MAG: diguanylate cyclase [bacterium]|nr:diguanylate cyclase [bacterium]